MPSMCIREDLISANLLSRLAICSLLLALAATSCRRSGGGKPTAGAPVPLTSQPEAKKSTVPCWATGSHIVELTITRVPQEEDVKIPTRINDPELIRRFEELLEGLRPRWRPFGGYKFGLAIDHKLSVTWENGQQCDYRLGGDMMLSPKCWVNLSEDQYKFAVALCQDSDKIAP